LKTRPYVGRRMVCSADNSNLIIEVAVEFAVADEIAIVDAAANRDEALGAGKRLSRSCEDAGCRGKNGKNEKLHVEWKIVGLEEDDLKTGRTRRRMSLRMSSKSWSGRPYLY